MRPANQIDLNQTKKSARHKGASGLVGSSNSTTTTITTNYHYQHTTLSLYIVKSAATLPYLTLPPLDARTYCISSIIQGKARYTTTLVPLHQQVCQLFHAAGTQIGMNLLLIPYTHSGAGSGHSPCMTGTAVVACHTVDDQHPTHRAQHWLEHSPSYAPMRSHNKVVSLLMRACLTMYLRVSFSACREIQVS